MNTQGVLKTLESKYLKKDLPEIRVGDLLRLGVLIREGDKERVQPFEGTVIARHLAGLSTTITVRRTFQGIGVERVFLIHSPRIESLQILRNSKVRRAKLYYLRDRAGKQARLQERFIKQKES
jgi:large subunit ribosomal protein L19